MNIYDIARHAGVSIATVSRVINHRGSVSEATRRRVLSVMEELGYTPNVFARGLGLDTMRMVGVMCSDVSDIFYAHAVSAIENELRLQGYDAILCCTGQSLSDKKSAMELLLSKRVDAIILVGSVFKEQSDNSHIEHAAARIPVIIINGRFEIPGTYCVLCDEHEAISRAVHTLYNAGRHHIAYLYDSHSFSGSSKLAGYRAAAEILGLPDRSVFCRWGIESAGEAVDSLMDTGGRLNAVLASEDILAIGAVKALSRQGIPVPGGAAVIGFNNSVLAECATPELTSIDNRVEALCTIAVRLLIDVFEGKDRPAATVITSRIVYRETFTAP